MKIFELLFHTPNCSICHDDITFQDKSCETKCKHHFHYDCLDKWSKQLTIQKHNFNCPVCRTDLAK